MTTDGTILNDGTPFAAQLEAPACQSAHLAAQPACGSPKPSLVDRCRREAAALESVDVETSDRRRLLSSVRFALACRGVGLGAMLTLTGEAQSGVSTIKRKAIKSLSASTPPDLDPFTRARPVLDLTLAAPTNLKTLIWSMLADLDPMFGMTTAASKIDAAREGRRLKHLLKAFRVEWLVIDRAEALAGDPEESELLGHFLGELRSAGVNLLFCGLDPVVSFVAETSALAIDAVHCCTRDYVKEDKEADRFARAFLDRCAIPSASHILDEPRFLEGLIAATAGRRGLIKSLIVRAAMIATTKSAVALTEEHFQTALSGRVPITQFAADSAVSSVDVSTEGSRRRRRKRRK